MNRSRRTGRRTCFVLFLICISCWGRASRAQRVSNDDANAAIRLYNQARDLYQKGKIDEAIALYRQALALNPANLEALNNLGLALDAQGKYDEAMADLTVADKLRPNDPITESNIGHVLYHEKEYEGAAAAYRKALALKSNNPDALNGMGAVLFATGRTTPSRTTTRLWRSFPSTLTP
jgi:Flp pilus assembly protein TadD